MAKTSVVQKHGGPTSRKYGGPENLSSDQEMWVQGGGAWKYMTAKDIPDPSDNTI